MNQNHSKKSDFVIHDYDYKIDRAWKSLEKDLSKENFNLIQKYDNLMINQALAKATRLKHLQILLNLCRILKKNWQSVSVDDIDSLVSTIMKSYGSENGQETNTSWDHKKVLKIFLRWVKLGSRDYREVGDPIETKHVKLRRVKDKIVREDLVTDDDVSRLLYACGSNLRDKALIDCHYEAGTRPGEILSLKIKHVKFDKNGAIIFVDGKTGARPIRLVTSTPNLAKWFDSHPLKNDPEAPLWILFEKENFGKPLTYSAARKVLERLVQKTGIQKRINLNLFRHSSATNSAKFMNEAQMRKRHGWTPYSKMPSRYVHMNNADVEDAIFSHHGLKKSETNENKNIPIACKVCDFPNSYNSSQCSKCGRPLNLEAALKIEENDKEQKDSLQKEIKKMKKELEEKIEELHYGPTARSAEYYKGYYLSKDSLEGQILSIGIPLLIEILLPENKKRLLLKEIKKSKEENRKADFSQVFDTEPLSELQKEEMRKLLKHTDKNRPAKIVNGVKMPRFRTEIFESLVAS